MRVSAYLLEPHRDQVLDEALWSRTVDGEVEESALGHRVAGELICELVENGPAEREIAQVILERREACHHLALRERLARDRRSPARPPGPPQGSCGTASEVRCASAHPVTSRSCRHPRQTSLASLARRRRQTESQTCCPKTPIISRPDAAHLALEREGGREIGRSARNVCCGGTLTLCGELGCWLCL